jgi:type II secretory pathway component GspD/PulD (secretin)
MSMALSVAGASRAVSTPTHVSVRSASLDPVFSRWVWWALVIGATAAPGASARAQEASIVPQVAPSIPAIQNGLGTSAGIGAEENNVRRIDLTFKNVGVADLIELIAREGNVGITINGDVTGTLKFVNLQNMTPEAAIKHVATQANLQWRKLDGNNYVVAKELPPEPAPVARIPEGMPTLDTETNTLRTYVQPELNGMPELVDPNVDRDGNEVRDYHYIPMKNVPVRVMAFILDSQNQPEPLQYAASRRSTENYFKKYLGQPAFAPEVEAARNGQYMGAPQSYNPYAPSGSSGFNNGGGGGGFGQFASPYVQGNAQFGFGGGGGNNNNNGGGRNNRNGGGRNGGGRNGRGGNQVGGAGGGGGGVFELPEGVDSITAVDPQNALLVFSTEAGYQRLQNIVAFLDQPLKQVEIEAQFVTVTSNNTSAFGIDFSTSNGPFTVSTGGLVPGNASFNLGFVRNNFQATLSALIATNRAKIVTAPRVTAINNLTASLTSEVSTPVVTTTVATPIGGQAQQGTQVGFITSGIGLTVTPTINNDDTITVVMQPRVQQQIQVPGSPSPGVATQAVETVANVRDGDTIVLGGLRGKNLGRASREVPLLSKIPILGALFRRKDDTLSDSDLIIFLTARIVRRYQGDDQAPVPGT